MEITPNFMIGSYDQVASKKKESNSDMTMDDFIKIMAASLKMPSMSSSGEGDSSTDFMGQMIQFNTLNQLQSLTESLNTTMLMTQQQQALSMIGKEVTLAQDSEVISGVVDKVRFMNGYATIQVGGKDYYLNSIQDVGVGEK